jgi:uncharacterized protein with von Willebrand factor type A (vWA) domain
MPGNYRYSQWDGSQEIPPLDAEELLDMLSHDLLEEGDLRRALERMMMRGGQRPRGDRLQGLRDLLDQLRRRREEQLSQYNLDSSMADIAERLRDIVEQERRGIEQRLQDAAASDAPAEMRDLLQQIADRKRQALDALPEDAAGMLQQLLDYEFMDQQAREDFDNLVNELRQKMLGNYFQGLQQSLQNLTPEDLAPVREMVRELNKLLNKRLSGEDTEQDFQDFMQRFGDMFPEGIEDIDDLVDYLRRQAAQMQSLLQSMSEEQRQQLRETMEALLRDDRLSWDLAQMAGLLEAISGEPLGRGFQFSGDTPLGLEEAMELMGRMGEYDDLERQFREAMRDLDMTRIDQQLAERLLGREVGVMLEELRRMTELLEESGFIKKGARDIELTPKAIRRIGERALKDIFSELRKDRSGDHDARKQGLSAEQQSETKPWEFGDPFLVDIGKSISNAVFRSGPGTPVQMQARDLEIHKTETLTNAATVIVLDMSMSMIRSGAFAEAKKVALALDTLMRIRYPRDYLELVVFSYMAVQLKAGRLLQSDWAINPRGTNIQEALFRARDLLAKRKSSNRQIILITDGQPTMYTASNGQIVRGWSPYEWPRYSPEAMEETLKEVRRCTRNGIKINLFMMANDPALVAFGKTMSQINKGRAFLSTPGRLGHYVLFDYLHGKSRII